MNSNVSWVMYRLSLPDCYFNSAGEVRVASVPCPYHRFQAFFRSLLTLPPLALSADEASNFSTYSMCRFLPSMADSLQLFDSERNCLGNWQDGARLPLNVRYSAERLETAAGVRRLCLAAIAHLLKHVTNPPTWLRLRGVLPHVQIAAPDCCVFGILGAWHRSSARAKRGTKVTH